MYNISFSQFKKYLEGKEPTAHVGVPIEKQYCPIYKFIKEKDSRVLEVCENYISISDVNPFRGSLRLPSPDWVTLFVALVDYNSIAHSSVSAEDALALLTSGQLGYSIEEDFEAVLTPIEAFDQLVAGYFSLEEEERELSHAI